MSALRALCAASAALLLGATSVTTSQYDNARTGATLTETALTPRSVDAAHFGKLAALHVDGDVYAQPLVVANLSVGGAPRDVVFVATEHDSVYAFDAKATAGAPLWHAAFADERRGVTPIPFRELACPFIKPEVGITATPVIDLATQTLYALARTKEADGGSPPRYVQRLHALDLRTGAEKLGGPVVIRATADGSGVGSAGGKLAFDPLRENPRASLLLVNGTVFLTWASSCDVGPYHGWVVAYDARSLEQTAVFVTSPDADDAGIWQGDTGPAADAAGNVFLATGNGAFDVAGARGGRDYGDSILRLTSTERGIAVTDFFTPFDQQRLNAEDGDLGSGGPLLLPDQPGPHRHLLVLGGKGGMVYVVDRDHMGGFHAGSDSHAVQTLSTSKSVFGAPAYWNGHVFILWSDDVLKDFVLRDGRLSAQPVARAAERFTDPGATPTVSADGAKDGVVWVIESRAWRAADRPAVLRAYDAANVAHELYDSEQRSARDRAGTALRFTIPTVANGRVYVGVKGELDVYGLLAR